MHFELPQSADSALTSAKGKTTKRQGVLRLTLLSALWLLLTANYSFFIKVTDTYPLADNAMFVVSLAVLVFAVILLVIALGSMLISRRWLLSILLILAAATAYFTDQMGIIFDRVMLINMLQTNPAEAADLLTPGFAGRFILLGLLPAFWVWKNIRGQWNFAEQIRSSLILCSVAVVLAMLCLLPFTDQYASFFRQHKSLRYYTTPLYPIYSAVELAIRSLKQTGPQSFVMVAGSAKTRVQPGHNELVIIVVGETLRVDHLGINGYKRQTTPKLSGLSNLLNYRQVTSCGTSTAVSVPCMFSFAGRESFDLDEARNTENVLDVLARAGVNILWRDNNSDSKGVAVRLNYQDYRTPETNPDCDEVECRDPGMLVGLQEYINQQQGDILIVLHQMGSHGPAYYKRYPSEFERFVPACQTAELSECSREEVINAYDNSVLYTDYFLSEVVALLKRNMPEYEAAMLYMGDHGESLGENGVYLHGMPYFLAPDEQIHVPFITWVGETSDIHYQQSTRLQDKPFSHDSLSCSLLVLFEIQGDLQPELRCDPYFIFKPE